jgi:hypothetical protein
MLDKYLMLNINKFQDLMADYENSEDSHHQIAASSIQSMVDDILKDLDNLDVAAVQYKWSLVERQVDDSSLISESFLSSYEPLRQKICMKISRIEIA